MCLLAFSTSESETTQKELTCSIVPFATIDMPRIVMALKHCMLANKGLYRCLPG